MIGNLKWNVTFAFGGMIVVFLLAWMNNLFYTALVRSIFAFVILFMLMFLFRGILGMIKVVGEEEEIEQDADQQVGTHVDLSTPEEESIDELFKTDDQTKDSAVSAPKEQLAEQMQNEQFKPIQPPKLSTSTEELTAALRQLAEEEGR